MPTSSELLNTLSFESTWPYNEPSFYVNVPYGRKQITSFCYLRGTYNYAELAGTEEQDKRVRCSFLVKATPISGSYTDPSTGWVYGYDYDVDHFRNLADRYFRFARETAESPIVACRLFELEGPDRTGRNAYIYDGAIRPVDASYPSRFSTSMVFEISYTRSAFFEDNLGNNKPELDGYLTDGHAGPLAVYEWTNLGIGNDPYQVYRNLTGRGRIDTTILSSSVGTVIKGSSGISEVWGGILPIPHDAILKNMIRDDTPISTVFELGGSTINPPTGSGVTYEPKIMTDADYDAGLGPDLRGGVVVPMGNSYTTSGNPVRLMSVELRHMNYATGYDSEIIPHLRGRYNLMLRFGISKRLGNRVLELQAATNYIGTINLPISTGPPVLFKDWQMGAGEDSYRRQRWVSLGTIDVGMSDEMGFTQGRLLNLGRLCATVRGQIYNHYYADEVCNLEITGMMLMPSDRSFYAKFSRTHGNRLLAVLTNENMKSSAHLITRVGRNKGPDYGREYGNEQYHVDGSVQQFTYSNWSFPTSHVGIPLFATNGPGSRHAGILTRIRMNTVQRGDNYITL